MTSFYAGRSSGSFYSRSTTESTWWYNDTELSAFSQDPDSGGDSIGQEAHTMHAEAPVEKSFVRAPNGAAIIGSQSGIDASPITKEPDRLPSVDTATPPGARAAGLKGKEHVASSSGHPSFYGKSDASGHFFRAQKQPKNVAADFESSRKERTISNQVNEVNTPTLPGNTLSVVPKRGTRDATFHALDKEIAACKSPEEAFSITVREGTVLDAANWANLIYAIAHLIKHSRESSSGQDVGRRSSSFAKDPRWARCCRTVQSQLSELTARDTANVLWSLATLALKGEPLFMESADALGGKLAVCDPISVSKAAWSLTDVPNRDRRLSLFTHLAVPVVLRAETFPIGALVMTCYAFAKAEHRDANVYEALSGAVERYSKEDLRPIDVCNVVWGFCTVGYRDDRLFTRICEDHLTDATALRGYNPQDLTNTAWGFSKVIFKHRPAMDAIAREGLRQCQNFKPIHFTNFFYSFATMRLQGPEGFLAELADTALPRASDFDSANLSILVWSLAMLKQHHGILDAAVRAILRPEVCRTLTSRTLSMLFLAFFRFGRIADADAIFDATVASGNPIGSSGFSAVMMTAEQGADASRERRLQLAMAHEAADDRMRAAIINGSVIRLMKRGLVTEARELLLETRASHPLSWTAVSARLLAQVAPDEESVCLAQQITKEVWVAPVQSGIHPIAATRQNEGPHAYTREFMTLQAVLCTAPEGDVDACMQAVEQFAESRSLWLKITAWEKAVVVYEVARLSRPKVVVEIGAYVGYSAMNLARAVRPHGGRVASIEVDPMHASIVRNMVEFAGLTDTVDVWTGYCYDVIPHLLDLYGPRSIGMVFMDQKGTRFHTDINLMEELDLLADGAVVLADNVLKPGAPLYIWELAAGPFTNLTAVSVREFLLQSEDWMVLGFHDVRRGPTPEPPPELYRLAFESDAFRKRSMFDSVAPSKSDWWAFSQRFNDGLQFSGCMPRIVGLHGRDNPVIQPADVVAIFERAGRLPK